MPKITIILMILFLLMTGSLAFAGPEISAFVGMFENGAKSSVSGSKFGVNTDIGRDAESSNTNGTNVGRVVLGDAELYADCTTYHNLTVAAWGESVIDLDVQIPEPLQVKNLYLFVLDGSGQVSSGFGPLVYGENFSGQLIDMSSPGTPGQPTLVF